MKRHRFQSINVAPRKFPFPKTVTAALLILLSVVQASSLSGQTAEIIAIGGEPFGVAMVRYPVANPNQATTPAAISSTDQQVLYPTFHDVTAEQPNRITTPNPGQRRLGGGRLLGRLADLVRGDNDQAEPQLVAREAWFLFRGKQPFNVIIDDATTTRVQITPTIASSERVFQNTLRQWWDYYTGDVAARLESGDYPPLVENYLVAMLSRRLGLPLPDSLTAKPEPETESILSTVKLVAGVESMRNRALTRVAQGDTEQFAAADLPLPEPPNWEQSPPLELIPADTQVDMLEPVASRVPIDSLYIRFGSFKNYLWFRDLGNQYGGDIAKMATLRGFDYQATKRIETQLNLEATQLTELLGGTVVDDMVIIGHDLFLTEGASIGVLFKAKNAFLLTTSLKNDRSARLSKTPAATMQNVTIKGREVSLLATPDNRLRSFLAVDGEYVLVSNSQTLIGEFLETGIGAPSLADDQSFQYARQQMPTGDDYKIFAYFSNGFFQSIVNPKYQIELRRRLLATADAELIQLAQLAARGEGRELTEIDQLTAGGYLPDGMGSRPDGSGPIVAGETVLNSKRGLRGYFLPIADVELEGVTTEEADWYAGRSAFYSQNWRQMDPLVAGIRVVDSPNEGLQRLQIHAEVAPLVPDKYGWIADQLGPPTAEVIEFGSDDIAAIQAYVVSDQLGGTIPPHHLFLAFKDALLPNPNDLDGLLAKYNALRSVVGYLGAWPQPGVLDRLPLGIGRGRPVGPGMSKLLIGLYRYQAGGFSILSFLPEVITASLPNLRVGESAEPAQVRLHVDNLGGSQIESWVNAQLYARNYRASFAGARLLNSLTTQLHVPSDRALETADRLLDASLQCPLGGTYVLGVQGAVPRWRSTAWEQPAEAYQAPFLTWFRGASGRLTQYDSRLVADLLLDMNDGL